MTLKLATLGLLFALFGLAWIPAHGAFFVLSESVNPDGSKLSAVQEWPNAVAFANGSPVSIDHGQRIGAAEWDFRAITTNLGGNPLTLQAATGTSGTYDVYRWRDALRFRENDGSFEITRYNLGNIVGLAVDPTGAVFALDRTGGGAGERSYRVLRWTTVAAFSQWTAPQVVGTRDLAPDFTGLDFVDGQLIGLIPATLHGNPAYEVRRWSNFTEFLAGNGSLVGTRAFSARIVDVFSERHAAAQPSDDSNRQSLWPWLGNRLPANTPGAPGGLSPVDAFPNVRFQNPVKMLPRPGRPGELWVAGREGHLWSVQNNPSTTLKTQVMNLTNATMGWGDSGLLGFVFHPEFGQPGSPNRGYLYVAYNFVPPGSNVPNLSYNRLSRFTLADGATTISRASELVLINQFDRHPWHNQGDLFFGADGFLYLGMGDEGELNNAFGNAQRLTGGLFAGVLRIDVDQNPTRSHPIRRQPQSGETPPAGWPASYTQGYFIPDDNPWQNANGELLEEFWAIGLRNPYRISRDPVTNQAFIGDVGQTTAEEVNLLQKGANYQWAFREGSQPGPTAQPSSLLGTSTPPYWSYSHENGNRCVIGGYVYRGTQHAARLAGQYVFGDYVSGRLWAMQWQGRSTPEVQQIGSTSGYSLSGFGLDHAGELYLMSLGFEGRILKLSATPTPQPPALLSSTGVFEDMATLKPARGLTAYNVNAPLWSDNAQKKRWLAIPNDGGPYDADEVITFRADSEWDFPVGTVLVKHFELPLSDLANATIKRLETRFMVKTRDNTWYGMTYKWRSDGSDADLLAEGQNETLQIQTASGGTRTHTWSYPSRNDCMTCHNTASTGVLGLRTWQVNHAPNPANPATTIDQLGLWSTQGLFDQTLTSSQINAFLKSNSSASATLETRARSYLDANCASCHRPGGAQAFFDARFNVPLSQQGLLWGQLTNSQGISGANVITPGNTELSMIHRRMTSSGLDQMPPLGRNHVDMAGLELLSEWINSLAPPTQPADLTAAFDGTSRIQLTWKRTSTNVSWFRIERRQDDGPWQFLASTAATVTTFTDSSVAHGAVNRYRVAAFNGNDSSPWSATAELAALSSITDWQQWQQAFPLNGQNRPLDDPDGDGVPNLLEFVLGQHPAHGHSEGLHFFEMAHFSNTPSLGITFSVRSLNTVTGVSLTLMGAPTLAQNMNWQPVSIQPEVSVNGVMSQRRYVSITNAPEFRDQRQGFIRLRARLDSTGEEAFSETWFWSSHEHSPGAATLAPTALKVSLLAGRVDSGSLNLNLNLSASLGGHSLRTLVGTEVPAYLEVVDGPLTGHRFDINLPGTTDTTLSLDPTSPHNTLSPIPDLTGTRFVIRHHQLLAECFIGSYPIASNNPAFADRVQMFNSLTQRWHDFWYWQRANADTIWVSADDATLSDQGSTVIPPGTAFLYRRRLTTTDILQYGTLRANPFVRPLHPGISLIAGGWPADQSPVARGMTLGAGFIGARGSALADRFMIWRPDMEPSSTEGFLSWFLLDAGPNLQYWTLQGSALLNNDNQTPLFQRHRGVFILTRSGHPNWRLPLPWNP
jgi:uncharacterized repeat protein (TIGR03806 family)